MTQFGKFLPVLSASGKGSITIQQCLSQSNGINAANLKQKIQEFKDAMNVDDAMKIIAELPTDTKAR
jgi:hypothetical protein